MENTGKILFEDDTAQWFVAMGDRWLGPLSASDVYKRIGDGQLSWAHFVWKHGQAEWKRICDVKTFQAAVPPSPAKSITTEVKKEAAKPEIRQAAKKYPSPPPVPGEKELDGKKWFLYYNNSQFGPFSKNEVENAVRAGKINGKIFVWQDGMSEWKRLDHVEVFKAITASTGKRPPSPPASLRAVPSASMPASQAEKKTDNRKVPRRPLVAKIVMAHDDSVTVAVCRDVSVGGMQVLTDRIPGSVGKKVKLNVSAMGQIEPFVADGIIVRILEDGRGFSFRFEKITESAKKAIESYIASSGA